MSATSPEITPGVRSGVYDPQVALSDLSRILPHPLWLVPLLPRSKAPACAGWAEGPALNRSPATMLEHFTGEAGIGLVCGPPSGGLCFVDVDCDDAVREFEGKVPQLKSAPIVIGSRGLKWLVRTLEPTRGFALKNEAGRKVGEFLSHRQQGVVAGLHPVTGHPYKWVNVGPVPLVNPLDLQRPGSNHS